MKKEFRLSRSDFNRIVEISANDKPLAQVVNGKMVELTKQERVDIFWVSVSKKYGFDPVEPVETNLPGKDATWFMAVEQKT